MRIGLVAPPWVPVPPTSYGGTEAVVDRLARGLAARGHDVVLFTTGDATCPVERRWVYDEARRSDLGNVAVELRHVLAAYASLGDVDIIHDHTVVGPLVAQQPCAPVVVTAHNALDDEEYADVYAEIGRRHPLVAISHAHAAGARGPVARVIHHGVEPELFPVGTGAGGYACYVGRMAPYKGILEAALIARRAGVKLVAAARMQTVDEHAYYAQEVEPLLGDGVEFIGEIAEAERLRLLGNAEMLLNPITWNEPFGLVMLEALACGTPVVTSRRGAAPEIVEDGVTGLVCEDVDDAVRRLPEVAALDRAACRAAVTGYFNAERMVDDYLRLFADVLSDGAREAPTGVGEHVL